MNILSDGASGFDRDLRLASYLHILGTDQHDTTFFPRASRCELCGRSSGLAIETFPLNDGVACFTVCQLCVPRQSLVTPSRVKAHAQHLRSPAHDSATPGDAGGAR